MGGVIGGAQNCRSYEEIIKERKLPQMESITYQGIFNSNYFPYEESNREELISLDTGYGVWDDLGKEEYFISTLIKTKYDGIGYRKPINVIFVIDKSGSMSSYLTEKSKESCIALAKNSIHKLIDKLDKTDKFSLVALDNAAHLIIPATSIEQIHLEREQINEKIDKIKANGGTSLTAGYALAFEEARKLKEKSDENTETRIIFTTDMNDTNEESFINYIKEASLLNIYTTIIGIGVSLNSNFLEKTSKNKGFNYFSAIEESDIQSIIVDEFNFNFFPVVYDLHLSLKSVDCDVIDCFGTEDKPNLKINSEAKSSYIIESIEHQTDNMHFTSLTEKETSITKVGTLISSCLKEENSTIYVKGGLVLIKLNKPIKEKRVALVLTYKCSSTHLGEEEVIKKEIFIDFEKKNNEKLVKIARSLYYYTTYVRKLLKELKIDEQELLQIETLLTEASFYKNENEILLSRVKDLVSIIKSSSNNILNN